MDLALAAFMLLGVIGIDFFTVVANGLFDRLGALGIGFEDIFRSGGICVCEVGVDEMLDDWPSVSVGEHASDDHIVVGIWL